MAMNVQSCFLLRRPLAQLDGAFNGSPFPYPLPSSRLVPFGAPPAHIPGLHVMASILHSDLEVGSSLQGAADYVGAFPFFFLERTLFFPLVSGSMPSGKKTS